MPKAVILVKLDVDNVKTKISHFGTISRIRVCMYSYVINTLKLNYAQMNVMDNFLHTSLI